MSEMMDVGALLKAPDGGFATLVAAMVTVMPIESPWLRALAAVLFLDGQGLHGDGRLAHRIPVNQP
ncbi:MAG TPA: hypothetical protein VGD96_04225 [Bradyrhizobium sp.]